MLRRGLVSSPSIFWGAHRPFSRRFHAALRVSGASRGPSLPAVMGRTLPLSSLQRHSYATAPGPSGSGGSARKPLDGGSSDAFASQHFDLQDVDADRLTHFFWDRNEEGGSPYLMDESMLNDMNEVLLMSEDNGESAWFVDPRDRRLLFSEYLYA